MQHPEPTAWALTPLRDRVAWAKRFRTTVARHEEKICKVMDEELGRSRAEGLLHEIAPLLAACKWAERKAPAFLADRPLGDTPWWMRGTRVVERRLPLGRVCIVASWQSPVQILGTQMVQALLAGNTVMVKPSERATRTQVLLMQMAVDAGLPQGTLGWTSPQREVGATLLATQKFDHVIFTGSTTTGRRVDAKLHELDTPSTQCWTGRDSALVLSDADGRRAAESLWGAVCLNHGQSCLAPKRALVMTNVFDTFVKTITKLAVEAKPVELIDEASAAHCKELVQRAVARGARDVAVLAKGTADPVDQNHPGKLFRPAALIDCGPDFEVVDGKHQGPILAIVKCVNLEEALLAHRRSDQHLAASIFTRDAALANKIAPRLGVTNIMINDAVVPAMHPAVSVCGRGPSGHGFSRGVEGMLAMTKPVYVSRSPGLMGKAASLKAWQLEMFAKASAWVYEAKKAPEITRAGAVPTGTRSVSAAAHAEPATPQQPSASNPHQDPSPVHPKYATSPTRPTSVRADLTQDEPQGPSPEDKSMVFNQQSQGMRKAG